MKDLVEKYYQFTLLVFVLSGAMFYFGGTNKEILMMIAGALVGALVPKNNSKE